MATQWPLIHARLVELLPTLAGWEDVPAFDGPPITGDTPRDYVTVGYVIAEDSAGTFSHIRSGGGYQVEETGGIRCELVSTVGETDLATVRARAFALLDALEQEIRRDQTLGVLSTEGTSALDVDVVPVQTTSGAQQRLVFTIQYFTRT